MGLLRLFAFESSQSYIARFRCAFVRSSACGVLQAARQRQTGRTRPSLPSGARYRSFGQCPCLLSRFCYSLNILASVKRDKTVSRPLSGRRLCGACLCIRVPLSEYCRAATAAIKRVHVLSLCGFRGPPCCSINDQRQLGVRTLASRAFVFLHQFLARLSRFD